MEKQTAITLLGIFLLAASLTLASAASYCFLGLGNGESTSDNFYTCRHTMCQVCTDANTKAYASWNKCSDACPDLPSEQPNLTLQVNWPFANGGVFTKTSFFLDIDTNQIASIYLIDNLAGTQRNLCPNCKAYSSSATFKEGLNDFTVRAIKGLEIKESRITFFIDNKKPYISKTLPASNKYASSLFTIYYTESNPQEIKLKYGNTATGMREAVLSDCPSGKSQSCLIDADLKDYDGSQITYWFEIKDIANNLAIGKPTKIYVDETAPAITSFTHVLGKGYVNFNMTIAEKNFYRIEYKDNNDAKPSWKTVCSSLNKGNCFKKLYFKTGEHDLSVKVSDKAGNLAEAVFSFTI